MREHTRTHHTKNERANHIREEKEEPMYWNEEMFQEWFGDIPEYAVNLRGLRYREGLSQIELGEMIGVEQTNISKMEKGKRPIGKKIAKKLADIFHTDYRLFL